MDDQRVERKLAAILAAELVGYSQLMGKDETGTRARFNAHLNELINPAIAESRGRLVKTTGDGILVEFASVVDAVQCAVEIQQGMNERNADTPGHQRIEFSIGVNLGDVIVEGDDIHGDGVNVAARIEGLCQPGEVYLSRTAHNHVKGKVEFSFEDLGKHELKNFSKPIQVYRVKLGISENNSPKSVEQSNIQKLRDKPSIAVLPFDNLSGEQEYFSNGITEDIITVLGRIRQFSVIARKTSFTYKGQPVDVQATLTDSVNGGLPYARVVEGHSRL